MGTCPKFNTRKKFVVHFFIPMLLLPLTPPLIYLKLKKIKGPKMDSLFHFHFTFTFTINLEESYLVPRQRRLTFVESYLVPRYRRLTLVESYLVPRYRRLTFVELYLT